MEARSESPRTGRQGRREVLKKSMQTRAAPNDEGLAFEREPLLFLVLLAGLELATY